LTVVLVTNDDGIRAPGLRQLVLGLAEKGYKVYVSAPRENMSGIGKALMVPARYGEARVPGAARAWWVESTPATAVYLALYALPIEKPDVVVSGVNKGPNMGLEDFLTSGTVGAAVEAALHGVPGVAVSLAVDRDYKGGYRDAVDVAVALVDEAARLPRGSILNINVPPRPRGVAATSLAWNNYKIPVALEDGLARTVGNTIERRYWDKRPGTDVWAVTNGLASITLVRLSAAASSGPGWAGPYARRVSRALGLPLEEPLSVEGLEPPDKPG